MQRRFIPVFVAIAIAVTGPGRASADASDVLKGVVALGVVAVIAKELRDHGVEAAPPSRRSSAYSPAAQAFSELSPAARHAIEARLSAWGYLEGRPDGHWDDRTWFAMRGFAFDAGMERGLHDRLGAFHIFEEIVLS